MKILCHSLNNRKQKRKIFILKISLFVLLALLGVAAVGGGR